MNDLELSIGDTIISRVVAATPDQLHEARLRIPAQMDEMDRELLAQEVRRG